MLKSEIPLIFNLIRKKYGSEHIHLPKCSYLHKEKRLIRLTTHLGLRKILGLNILYAQNLFRLKNKTNLKTRSIDIQAHK